VLADIMKDKDDFWVTRAQYEEKGVHALAHEATIV